MTGCTIITIEFQVPLFELDHVHRLEAFTVQQERASLRQEAHLHCDARWVRHQNYLLKRVSSYAGKRQHFREKKESIISL